MTKLSQVYLHSLTVSQVEDAVLAMGSTRHAQVALASLKLALRDAAEKGHRFDERILNVKPPRHVAKPRSFLDWEQVLELSSWMPEFIRRIVPVAALTGLRQGELFDLRESDLVLSERGNAPDRSAHDRTGQPPASPEAGTSGTSRPRSESYLIVRSGKTESAARRVVLPATAVQLLREQLLARKHTRGGYVFPASEGGRMSTTNFMQRIYRPAVKRAGLEGVTFHALRRTYVSLGAKAGMRQEVIEKAAGWAPGTASEMWKLYRQVYESEVDTGISMLDALVSEPQPEREEEAK